MQRTTKTNDTHTCRSAFSVSCPSLKTLSPCRRAPRQLLADSRLLFAGQSLHASRERRLAAPKQLLAYAQVSTLQHAHSSSPGMHHLTGSATKAWTCPGADFRGGGWAAYRHRRRGQHTLFDTTAHCSGLSLLPNCPAG